MADRPHTDRQYERELAELREKILLIGAEVEEMIAASLAALVQRDSPQARQVIERDREVDLLELRIDEVGLHLLALRQPVASDLRFITMALKIVRDLERIGDLAVNISERVLELNEEPPLKPYLDIPRMADVARGMVRDVLDAFVNGDADRAREVIDRDHTVDGYHEQIFRELLTYMMESPRNIPRATRLQSIAKHLERIGDHATNVAEMVIFMVQGKDVRHGGGASERDRNP